MKTIALGNIDSDPDVCATAEGWLVAGVPIEGPRDDPQRQPLRLLWFDRNGGLVHAVNDVYTGQTQGGVFPRLAPAGPRIWLGHLAVVDTVMQATLRTIVGHAVTGATNSHVLGPADGSLALNGDWLAWQHAGKVYGQRLWLPLPPRVVLRGGTRPTGLSHLDSGWPVFNDENRESILGMYNPVRDYGIVVGEGLDGGIAVCAAGTSGVLFPDEICGTPRGAMNEEGEYAAVCWGGSGAKLILFTADDLGMAL